MLKWHHLLWKYASIMRYACYKRYENQYTTTVLTRTHTHTHTQRHARGSRMHQLRQWHKHTSAMHAHAHTHPQTCYKWLKGLNPCLTTKVNITIRVINWATHTHTHRSITLTCCPIQAYYTHSFACPACSAVVCVLSWEITGMISDLFNHVSLPQ